jgi:hypothetical protein
MATEKPHKYLLDRDLYSVIIKEQFAESLSLLEELVNFGSNLIPRCFESSDKKLHEVGILLNFLKQGVALLDSIHILAPRGATTPCFLSLRSLFEISVYLEWIFQKETEKRGTLPFVWNLRNKLYWTRCVKPGTPEHEAHKQHMADTITGPIPRGLDTAFVDAEIALLNSKLSAPECAAINAEFDRIKKGQKDKEWYCPAGVNNFREMAKAVGKEGQYKVFFGHFSGVTHGVALDKQISFSKEQVVYEPIRNLTEMDQILRCALTLAVAIYRTVLHHYRYGELENYDRKYVNEWRSRFLSVKAVEYKDGTYTIKENHLTTQALQLPTAGWHPSK